MAVSSCYAMRAFPSFECRSDPDFSGHEIPTSGPRFTGKLKSGPTHLSFGLSSMILRFPPNFVRQLSNKARRNCSNIGVAQVVAASWSNNQPPKSAAAVATDSAAAVEAAIGSGYCKNDEENIIYSNNNKNDNSSVVVVQPEEVNPLSFLSSDGSLAIHAGTLRLLISAFALSIYFLDPQLPFILYCIYLLYIFIPISFRHSLLIMFTYTYVITLCLLIALRCLEYLFIID